MDRGSLLRKLRSYLGPSKVIDDPLIVRLYCREASGLEGDSFVVVMPESNSEVSRILSLAYETGTPVYPQGSSTDLVGGAVPGDGIILSLERMRRVIEVSTVDQYAWVEAGVRIGDLNSELAAKGLQFPVDPGSSSVATVGGAINSGAGGLKGVRYGSVRDWVLGLTIVLPDSSGTVLRIGCKTLKCRQGYDLVRLIVGSEGTLAVVTEAILRITRLPERVAAVLAFFRDVDRVVDAALELKRSIADLVILEYMDHRTSAKAASLANYNLTASGHMLLVGVAASRESAPRILKEASDIIAGSGGVIAGTADSPEGIEEFLRVRRNLYPAQVMLAREHYGVNDVMVFIEDIAVPPSRLAEALKELIDLESRYGLPIFIGGHLGEGNLHPAVGFPRASEEYKRRALDWHEEVMKIAVRFGGTVSAEHGIGVLKKRGLEMELEAMGSLKALELMRGIKRVFDPKNILNPGKVV